MFQDIVCTRDNSMARVTDGMMVVTSHVSVRMSRM